MVQICLGEGGFVRSCGHDGQAVLSFLRCLTSRRNPLLSTTNTFVVLRLAIGAQLQVCWRRFPWQNCALRHILSFALLQHK
jgi:hypothetical protein